MSEISPPSSTRAVVAPGVAMAVTAYIAWGLFPLYFKALSAAPLEVLAHRVVGAAMFLGALLGLRRRWAWLPTVVARGRTLALGLLSALLLAANWLVYIWAVQNERVVDASLGYFITPLISVLIGVMVYGERLRPLQHAALGFACAGVAWLTWQFGELPWVGLTLALTFGSYGALRKSAALGAAEGLMFETLLLFPLAAGYLALSFSQGESALLAPHLGSNALLLCAGPLTAIPLLLFVAGVRRVPLSLAGILQYISPSLQLLLGVWLWREPFPPGRALGYALIGCALVLYGGEGLRLNRARRQAIATTTLGFRPRTRRG